MKKIILSIFVAFGCFVLSYSSLFADTPESSATPKETGFFISLSPTFSDKWDFSVLSYTARFITTVSSDTIGCKVENGNVSFGMHTDKICVTTTNFPPISKKVTVEKSSLGYKLGYKFPNFRAYYTMGSWEGTLENLLFKINKHLLIGNWLYKLNNFQFFIGAGVGKGKIEIDSLSLEADGNVTLFDLGANYSLTENFHIGVGYLQSTFRFKFNKQTLNLGTNNQMGAEVTVIQINEYAESTLKRNTFFLDLTYSF